MNERGSALIDYPVEFGSRVYDVIVGGKRKKLPPAVRKVLEKIGNLPITEIQVCRQPVQRLIKRVLNLFTSGEINKHYDELFHLFMKFKVGGQWFFIEKNEVIRLAPYFESKAECVPVEIDKKNNDVTMNTMILKAWSAVGDDFVMYDGWTNNCQVFITNLLRYSGLLTDPLYSFINQNVAAVLKDKHFAHMFSNFITDLAAKLDFLISGHGYHEQILFYNRLPPSITYRNFVKRKLPIISKEYPNLSFGNKIKIVAEHWKRFKELNKGKNHLKK